MKTYCSCCCSPQTISVESCGCCEGVEINTPLPIYNRPGLSEIQYRVGTHSDFFESMLARMAGYYLEHTDTDGKQIKKYPLQGLTIREKSDPSIALLDAWASVGDVLTFYQERIANEGYLRTATERRSILELSRLVGYKPRPGISSSVFLAYSIDENFTEETVIPMGSRVQSIPGPDELPQAFETSADLKARAQWNNLQPRMSQPQTENSIRTINANGGVEGIRVYLKGVSTNLKISDPLLIQVGNSRPTFHRINHIDLDAINDRTLVVLRESIDDTDNDIGGRPLNFYSDLALKPSVQPRNTLRLKRAIADQFKSKASASYSSVASFTPRVKRILKAAAENAIVTKSNEIRVYHLTLKTPLFGHNFPRKQSIPVNGGPIDDEGDWPIIEDRDVDNIHENEKEIYLNASYDSIIAGSWVVIQTPQTSRLSVKRNIVAKVGAVDSSITRAKYGSVAASTRIDIDFSSSVATRWIRLNENSDEPSDPFGDDFNVLRATTVYAQPQELELAEEPIKAPICGGTDDQIELNGFYENLESGRWVIVSGEREIQGTSGVRFSELAMISSVTQDVFRESETVSGIEHQDRLIERPDEKTHTFITLAEELAYCFKRDTVTIHGNVVKATHGESRHEVLGSGSGASAFQSFELKQFPLTHVSANNPTGIESSLKVLVNDIEWHESDSLAELTESDRKFVTKTDNQDITKIIFGNGIKGARLPTGSENIRAMYRNGIGKDGNVNAEQISTLSTKPLGVKDVINPLPASGGANRETRDQARKNVPLAIKALDRLVSVQDYQDFSRVYAGVGKAHAVEISDGRQQLVHVTIAGAEDIPIDENSDVFRNLRSALRKFGDPNQVIRLAVRELMFITLEAAVAILPNYQWESVEPNLREKLIDSFSFESRELGQSVALSEVVKVMQAVRGVAYVDINAFSGIPEKRALNMDEIAEMEKAESNGRNDSEIFVPPYNRVILSPDDITRAVAEALYTQNSDNVLSSVRKPISQHLYVSTATIDSSNPENNHIRPAQLAFFTPEVPSTLILNLIESAS